MIPTSDVQGEAQASQSVLFEVRGLVGIVTLNEPHRRNAFSLKLKNQLAECLHRVNHDPHIRACVIAANGPAFCGGGDISGMVQGDLLEYRQRMRGYHDIVRALVDGPKPFVAAVNGAAYGAGFSLAMACDHVVAAQQARFCSAFARLNLIPDMGLLHTLVRRVGLWNARRMMMTSEVVDADSALRLGVADQIVEADDLNTAAILIAGTYAELAPDAFALLKSAFAAGAPNSLEDVLRLETEMQAVLRTTEGHIDAVQAFLSSRPASARPSDNPSRAE